MFRRPEVNILKHLSQSRRLAALRVKSGLYSSFTFSLEESVVSDLVRLRFCSVRARLSVYRSNALPKYRLSLFLHRFPYIYIWELSVSVSLHFK